MTPHTKALLLLAYVRHCTGLIYACSSQHFISMEGETKTIAAMTHQQSALLRQNYGHALDYVTLHVNTPVTWVDLN